MNELEILAAAVRWHNAHVHRREIGAENARRLKAERGDYCNGRRQYFGPASSETRQLVTDAKRVELAALRALAKVCTKVRASQTHVCDANVIDISTQLISELNATSV